MNTTNETLDVTCACCGGIFSPELDRLSDECPWCTAKTAHRSGSKWCLAILALVAGGLLLALHSCDGAENLSGKQPGVKGGNNEVNQAPVKTHTVGAPVGATTGASCVSEEFLDGIAQRESGNNPAAKGRHGEAGAYQLRPCAVQAVNTKWGWACSHRVAAVQHGRAYARAYCMLVEERLRPFFGRSPTQQEVYNAYRIGPSGAIRNAARRAHSTGTNTPAVGAGVVTVSTLTPDQVRRVREWYMREMNRLTNGNRIIYGGWATNFCVRMK